VASSPPVSSPSNIRTLSTWPPPPQTLWPRSFGKPTAPILIPSQPQSTPKELSLCSALTLTPPPLLTPHTMRQWLISVTRPSPWETTHTAPSDPPRTKSTSPYTVYQGATCLSTRRTSSLCSPSPSRMLSASRSSQPGSCSLTQPKGQRSPPPRWWSLSPRPTSPNSETLSHSSLAPAGS